MAMLKPSRLDKIRQEISIAQAKDAFVDALLFTQFSDKADILKHLNPLAINGAALERHLRAGLKKKLSDFSRL